MKYKLLACLALCVLLAAPHHAQAITVREFMEKMPKEEHKGYLFGAINMLAMHYRITGDETRADCIIQKFYHEPPMMKRIYATLLLHPNKPPEGVIFIIMKRACGG